MGTEEANLEVEAVSEAMEEEEVEREAEVHREEEEMEEEAGTEEETETAKWEGRQDLVPGREERVELETEEETG